jgi:hypothetical protein
MAVVRIRTPVAVLVAEGIGQQSLGPFHRHR